MRGPSPALIDVVTVAPVRSEDDADETLSVGARPSTYSGRIWRLIAAVAACIVIVAIVLAARAPRSTLRAAPVPTASTPTPAFTIGGHCPASTDCVISPFPTTGMEEAFEQLNLGQTDIGRSHFLDARTGVTYYQEISIKLPRDVVITLVQQRNDFDASNAGSPIVASSHNAVTVSVQRTHWFVSAEIKGNVPQAPTDSHALTFWASTVPLPD